MSELDLTFGGNANNFEERFEVKVLPYNSSEDPVFENTIVKLDPMRDSTSTIKEKLGVRALIVHGARILDDSDTIRNWYSPKFPIIVVECGRSFEEPDTWAKNPNYLARLLNAHVNLRAALICLSRAYWQEGYQQFVEAASFLRGLVDSTGLVDYQRRTELICVTMPRKELMTVAPFTSRDRNSRELLIPPSLLGDHTGGKIIGEWVDIPRPMISSEESAQLRQKGLRLRQLQPYLKMSTKAVVRIFGVHPISPDVPTLEASERHRIIPATGFFVSPTLILTTRTIKFNEKDGTYAQKFLFTHSTRAVHGMLREGVDMFECKEVPRQVGEIARVISLIGVEVPDSRLPAGASSAPWCDLMLMEVTSASHAVQDTGYLLPQLNTDLLEKGDDLFTLHYPSRPSADYISDVFGQRGYNSTKLNAETVGTQFWDYNQLMCSMGSVQRDVDDRRELHHNCSVLPGSRGAPIIHRTYINPSNVSEATVDDEFLSDRHLQYKKAQATAQGHSGHGGGRDPAEGSEDAFRGGVNSNLQASDVMCTFAGIQIGRSSELLEAERSNIISMSTSDVARQEGLAANMYNEAVPTNHIVLILLYLLFISKQITNQAHRNYLNTYLSRYHVLITKEILAQCHSRMLKDADDCNEYGMDFYEHQDLPSALSCFREGARMFTTASIPGLSESEVNLKTALQTNVSSVVVAMKMHSNKSNDM